MSLYSILVKQWSMITTQLSQNSPIKRNPLFLQDIEVLMGSIQNQ